MSLVNLSHLCSHLQNASKARLALTSVPPSNLHLSLCRQLLKQGLLSSIFLGGPAPPPPSALLALPGSAAATTAAEPVTQENVSSRRLWLGLKYWHGEPVLSTLRMVSKPTRRVWMGREELGRLARGERRGFVGGVRGVGELLFVSTDRGVMEVRECVERRVGGMVLCRVL